jgi:hypothetical protein
MDAKKSRYDLVMAKLDGAQGVVRSKEATVRTMPMWGIEGGSELWVIQTVRQVIPGDEGEPAETGEFAFIDYLGSEGQVRLVLPPEVTAVLYRQRDAVSVKHRRISSKATMRARMEAGYRPTPPRRRSR